MLNSLSRENKVFINNVPLKLNQMGVRQAILDCKVAKLFEVNIHNLLLI